MSYPAICVPILGTNVVGLAVLGAAGYLLYKAGKKKGLHGESEESDEPMGDRAVKGAMKTAYRAKKKVDESLSKSKDKMSEMWSDAKDEVEGKPE